MVPARRLSFAYSPENLRLGSAIAAFTQAERVVVGVRDDAARAVLAALFAPIASQIEWMSVESAEMTKHAINAFLATSVAFINEIAVLCEEVGADARQVERGLKTERRIGPRRVPVAGRRVRRRHARARRGVPRGSCGADRGPDAAARGRAREQRTHTRSGRGGR